MVESSTILMLNYTSDFRMDYHFLHQARLSIQMTLVPNLPPQALATHPFVTKIGRFLVPSV